MKLKFRTEKTCWHNGRYYEEGAVVECDCKFCKEGSVPYFTPIEEEKNVSQETIKEEKVEKEVEVKTEKKVEEPKVEEPKEEVKPKKRNKIEIV